MANPVALEGAERERCVRRNTALLAVALTFVWVGIAPSVVIGPVVLFELTNEEWKSGAFSATFSVSIGAGALLAGRLMDRFGRRLGLALGGVWVGIGGGVCALGIASQAPGWLFVGGAVFGAGMGASLLARGAVADMYAPAVRGRAVGIALAAVTIGAVGGPPLVGAVQALFGDVMENGRYVIPMLIAPAAMVIVLTLIASVRPDPSVLAVRSAVDADVDSRALSAVLRQRPLVGAIVAMIVAQAVMTGIMALTPLVVHQHGGGGLQVAGVISVHFGGMFAFSPLVGFVLDRWGRRAGLVGGMLVLLSGAVVGTFFRDVGFLWAGMFLVGIGWSATYLSTTAVVSDLTQARERSGTLGFVDLLTQVCSAAGVLGAGFLLQTRGFGALGISASVLVIPALVATLRLRERAPGQWAPEAA